MRLEPSGGEIEKGDEVRVDGVGGKEWEVGMEDEGRKGRWAYQAGLTGLSKDFGFALSKLGS